MHDASARAREKAPSLNECLHAGPPLQNKLWNVIVRNRLHPVAVAGDLRRAFLQVRIRETERDALRFHWIADKTAKQVETLRFTRVVFGLAPSPFLLNGVIQQHLEILQFRYPDTVNEIRKSLYVDDLISGGPTTDKAKCLKHEPPRSSLMLNLNCTSGIRMKGSWRHPVKIMNHHSPRSS